MHPKNLSISDYHYDLPEYLIAKYPSTQRDESKLLVYRNGQITVDIYKHVDKHIPGDSVVIFNNTRVVEARILFKKPTGGVIEIFCLEPHDMFPDITSAMLQKQKILWRCLVGGASKWKHGQILEKSIIINGSTLCLRATCLLYTSPSPRDS